MVVDIGRRALLGAQASGDTLSVNVLKGSTSVMVGGTAKAYTGGIFLALIFCLGLLSRVTVTGPLTRLGSGIREIVRTGRFEAPCRGF